MQKSRTALAAIRRFAVPIALGCLHLVATNAMAAPAVKFETGSLVTPGSFASSTTHTVSVPNYATPYEIVALAKSLGANRIASDPNFSSDDYAHNVFEYVRNNIATEFRYGLSKGARGAIIDQSGTSFDQAHLMVELLRQGSVTASYELGTITLTADQFGKWTGLVDNLDEVAGTFVVSKVAACWLLADGGIPASFNGSTIANCGYSGNLSGTNAVTLNHIWVSAGGNAYDPSFKEMELFESIDLSSAMGCGTDASSTCGSQIITAFGSTTGGTVPSKTAVNESAITSKLVTFATNLAADINTNHTAESIEDVLGGGVIDLTLPAIASTLSYATGVTSWSGDIPDVFRASVRIQFTTEIDETYYIDEIYGERMRLFPHTDEEKLESTGISGRPSLWMGPTQIVIGSTTQAPYVTANDKAVTLTMAYPYPASGGAYMDETHVFNPRVMDPDIPNGGDTLWKINPIALLFSFGKPGGEYESRIAEELSTESIMKVTGTDCTFTCSISKLYGYGREMPQALAKWMSEAGRLFKLQEAVAGVRIQHHGSIGFMEEVRINGGGFTPVTAVSRFSVTHKTDDTNKTRAASITLAGALNALEGGAGRRQYNTPHGTSAVSLFKLANWTQPATSLTGVRFNPLTYIHITSANLATALTQLTTYNETTAPGGYQQDRKNYISNLVNAGYEVVAPKEGEVGKMHDPFIVEWNVIPLYAYKPDGSEVALLYMNSAGALFVRKGGGTGMDEQLDPLETALATQEAMKNPEATLPAYDVSLSNGALQLSPPPDITTGSGGFPYSLSFQRSYDSTGKTEGYGSHVLNLVKTTGGGITFNNTYHNKLLGWSHNYNINAAAVSDAHQGLGADSVRDASAAIAALKVANMLNVNTDLAAALSNMFVLNWFDDQLYDNAVAVTGGAGAGTYLRSPDGSEFYPPNASAAELTQTGAKTAPNKNNYRWDYSGITYDLTTKEGQALSFDERQGYASFTPGARLSTWTFPEGVTVTLTWTGSTIWKVENNLGRTLDFDYNFGGTTTGSLSNDPMLKKVIDDSGREVSYAYATLSTKAESSSCCGSEPTTEITDFTVVTYLTSFTDPENNTIKYEYSNSASTTFHDRFDVFLDKIYKASDQVNPFVTLLYDEAGRVSKATDILGQATDYYPSGLSTEQARRGSIVNALGEESVTYFNEQGVPYRAIDALGNETSSTFDGIGRIVRTVDAEDIATEYKYDAKHNQIETRIKPKPGAAPVPADIVTTSFYDVSSATNDLKWVKDAFNRQTDLSYTNGTSGLVTKIQAPAVYDPTSASNVRPEILYTYDTRGLMTGVVESDGTKTCYSYDAANKFILKTVIASCQAGGLNLIASLTANARGDITSVDGPRTDVTDLTSYIYDNRRRVTDITGADPDDTGPLIAPLTKIIIDADGLVDRLDRATGDSADPWATTDFYYDAVGKLIKVRDPDSFDYFVYHDFLGRPTVTVDGEGRKARTVYDALNRPSKIIHAWAGLTDGTGATLDCAQMRVDTAADPTKLQQCYQEYTYTANDQIETVKDAKGNKTGYTYDGFDRLSRICFPDKTTVGVVSATDCETYAYDVSGNMTAKVTRRGYNGGGAPAEQITYTYDALNRLTERLVPGSGADDKYVFTYDLAGRLLSAKHYGVSVTYEYDAAGRLENQKHAGQMPVSYSYDQAGNVKDLYYPDTPSGFSGRFAVHFEYDALNRVIEAKSFDGAGAHTASTDVLANVSYDALSRRQGVAYANATSASYTYTKRGDLTCNDWNLTGAAPANCNDAGSEIAYDFAYNGVGQTVTESVSDPLLQWAPAADGTDAYVSNGLNQYASITPAGGTQTSLVYDGNGNMTTDVDGRVFAYDAENVLQSVTDGGASLGVYAYYADGNRRIKAMPTGNTRYYYDGDQEILETFGSIPGAVQRRYVRLPDSVDEPFLMIDYTGTGCSAGCRSYAHQNRLGSVVAVTDNAGAVTERHTYSPYGESGGSTSGFPFRFTGQKLDDETGLYYYKARYYDPETGRFLQTDPIGYADQMNLYAYAGNDPANGKDPTGTESGFAHRQDEAVRAWRKGDITDKQLESIMIPCGGNIDCAKQQLGATALILSIYIPGPEDVVLAAAVGKTVSSAVRVFTTLRSIQKKIKAGGRLVLYSGKVPSGLKDGDFVLDMKKGWSLKTNDKVIKTAIKAKRPIGDTYVDEAGNLIPARKGSVLEREREQLRKAGWRFNVETGQWEAPVRFNSCFGRLDCSQ